MLNDYLKHIHLTKKQVSLNFMDANHFEYFCLSLFLLKQKQICLPLPPPPPSPPLFIFLMHSPVSVQKLSFYFFSNTSLYMTTQTHA